MRQQALPVFRAQRERFALRFTCEHCSYFVEASARCSHGYPNAEHREARADDAALVFCKEFELF